MISGIEIACWDIVGKALDQPIYNLMGGKVHERLRSYTYLYPAMLGEEMDAADANPYTSDAVFPPMAEVPL